MITEPRDYKILNVELNWARLAKPVNPFGTEQYELQIATTDKAVADEWKANYLNVNEKEGKFVVGLKRKAKKADGTDNAPVRVYNADNTAFEDPATIGNGTIGNVIVWQYPYDAAGRKGVAGSLTAVQVVKLEKYEAAASTGFDVVETADEPARTTADLF